MSPYAKAIFAFLSSLIGGLGLVAPGGITLVELLGVLSVVIVNTGGVFGLTNTPTPLNKPV